MKKLFAFICGAACALAQTTDPEMSADRPGFRNSTHLVGQGVVQFENGLRLFSEGERTGVALDPSLRFGATNWLEFRLYADTIVLRSPEDPGSPERIVGASDLQPGIKFPIIGRKGGSLRVVAILETSVPTGHPSQSSDGYQPGSQLIFQQELPRDFAIAGTWNVTRLKDEHFVWQHAGSLQLNRSFERTWNTFAEVYALSPMEAGAGNQWVSDLGVTKTIGRNLMLDASVARSFHGQRSWYAMVGLSVRSHVPWPSASRK